MKVSIGDDTPLKNASDAIARACLPAASSTGLGVLLNTLSILLLSLQWIMILSE